MNKKVTTLMLAIATCLATAASAADPTTAALIYGGQTTISICYPVCVDSSAADYFNYTINGGAVTIIPPGTLLADNQTVLLNVSGLVGTTYTVDISGGVETCVLTSLPAVTIHGSVNTSLTIADIGAPSLAGVAFSCGPNQLGLIAGGAAYSHTPDQMTFAYASITGDFDKKAQIASLSASDPADALARAGLMARASVDPSDPTLKLLVSNPAGDNAVRCIVRADAGHRYDEVDHAYGGVSNNLPNQWIRMKRVGNSFQMFVGTDGVNWARVAQTWREFPSTMLVGLYAAASKDGSTNTVQFGNYSDVDLGDHTAPTLVSVGTLDKKTVGVKFSESVNSATATVLAHYTVRNADNSAATVASAAVGIEGDAVYLSVTGLISDTFTVSVTAVTDSAGNVIAPASAAGKVQPWISDDIGFIQDPAHRPTAGDDPGRVGQAVAVSSDDGPEVEIVGGGSNLWDGGDYGHYLHRTMTGDFDMMVQISRYDRCYTTGGYPNAGLMVRNNLYNPGEEFTQNGTKAPYYANITYSEDDASGWTALAIWRNSPHDGTHDSLGDGGEQCCFNVNRSDLIDGINGTFGSLRAGNASGTPIVNSSPNGARWLRIKRVGNHFTSYASNDGVVWRNYEELDHPMNATVEVGMFTMNDSGAAAPPNNAYDGGNQRASHYSVIHLNHFGATPALSVVRSTGNSATLSWGTGTLQTAPSITGPWTDALNQTSPQTVASFSAKLDGLQDGVVTPASGSGTLSLSGVALTFNNITYSGLSGNSVAAHIHGPAAPGVSTGVLYPLTSFTTLGAKSGAFNGTLTLVAGTGGFTLTQQLQQLASGLWYINIHTSTHPGGEIRGQILPGATMQFFRLRLN